MPLNIKHATLGMRIQRLRKSKKMDLNGLANKTGYPKEYLQKIEEDEIIPPVASLLKLSRALEVDSNEFLKKDADALERRADAVRRRTDRYSYEVLTPDSLHSHMKSFLVTIDPTSDLEGASYQHDGEEFIYVLHGQVTVMVGENRNELKQGDNLHFDSSIGHKLSNSGESPCELLVVLYIP